MRQVSRYEQSEAPQSQRSAVRTCRRMAELSVVAMHGAGSATVHEHPWDSTARSFRDAARNRGQRWFRAETEVIASRRLPEDIIPITVMGCHAGRCRAGKIGVIEPRCRHQIGVDRTEDAKTRTRRRPQRRDSRTIAPATTLLVRHDRHRVHRTGTEWEPHRTAGPQLH